MKIFHSLCLTCPVYFQFHGSNEKSHGGGFKDQAWSLARFALKMARDTRRKRDTQAAVPELCA